jgi:hypothetical protein
MMGKTYNTDEKEFATPGRKEGYPSLRKNFTAFHETDNGAIPNIKRDKTITIAK